MDSPWRISATEELNKGPELKESDLIELRQWINSQVHLPTDAITDEMILHFLHACFYNVETTKKTLGNFYHYKTTMPDFFCNWDTTDPALQDIVSNVLITAPLPNYDMDGLKLIVFKLNDTNVKKFNYTICIKWLLMTTMHSLWDLGIEKGFVIIYDASGFSISHCLRCSLSQAKNYIDFGKNAAPMRVVKIVFVNTSIVVEKMLALVRPFLNKELLNMMNFHSNPNAYFKDLPLENVPEDYGGSAPSLLSLHREFATAVLKNSEWLRKEEDIKSDKNKRENSHAKKESKKLNHKLEID